MTNEEILLLYAKRIALLGYVPVVPGQPKPIVDAVEDEPRPELLALQRVPGEWLH
jgi:hypothetical protein